MLLLPLLISVGGWLPVGHIVEALSIRKVRNVLIVTSSAGITQPHGITNFSNTFAVMGKKRSVDGKVKSSNASSTSRSSNRSAGAAQLNETPPNAQPPPPTKSSTSEDTPEPQKGIPVAKKQKLDYQGTAAPPPPNQHRAKPSKSEPKANHARHFKQPRLPDRTLYISCTEIIY